MDAESGRTPLRSTATYIRVNREGHIETQCYGSASWQVRSSERKQRGSDAFAPTLFQSLTVISVRTTSDLRCLRDIIVYDSAEERKTPSRRHLLKRCICTSDAVDA
jgi:hypothetical protein